VDKLGDVKRASGDMPAAVTAYEESLVIARRLSGVDPSNVQWSTDLVVALYKLALVTEGDQRRAYLDEALKIVEALDAEGKLSPDKKNWKNMLLALREPH
jgi:hypothetical protein